MVNAKPNLLKLPRKPANTRTNIVPVVVKATAVTILSVLLSVAVNTVSNLPVMKVIKNVVMIVIFLIVAKTARWYTYKDVMAVAKTMPVKKSAPRQNFAAITTQNVVGLKKGAVTMDLTSTQNPVPMVV
jgi:hypothetical protein